MSTSAVRLGQTMAAAGAALGTLCRLLALVPSKEMEPSGQAQPLLHPSPPQITISECLQCQKDFQCHLVVIRLHTSLLGFIFIHCSIYNSPLITGMVTRQSVRGNKNRFPKPDIINSALHPSWFKSSTKCKYKSDTWRLLQVLLNREQNQREART